MSLPADVREVLSYLSFGISFGLGSMTDVLTCSGLHGFVLRLTFWWVVPLVLIAVIMAGSLAIVIWEQRRALSDEERGLTFAKLLVTGMRLERGVGIARRLMQIALRVVLRVLFLVYPLVTNAACERGRLSNFAAIRAPLLPYSAALLPSKMLSGMRSNLALAVEVCGVLRSRSPPEVTVPC